MLDRQQREGYSHDKIDLEILFDPNHGDWLDHYTFEDVQKEELIELIRFKMQTRFGLLTGGLVGFYVARFNLWHRGIGAKFFHYTRFLSIPTYIIACIYSFYFTGPKLLR